MPEKDRNTKDFKLRAKLPQYVRIAAAVALAAAVGVVIVAFYRERNKPTFHLKSEHAQLSNEVVAEVTSYERLETDGDTPKYFVKADRAKTFSDNHQELENVFIQTYDQSGKTADRLGAEKGLYIPEENKNFTIYLSGSVNIETRDALKVKTAHVVFTKKDEVAEADEPVEFERDNVSGTSRSAVVKIAEKRIELDRDVQIESSRPLDGSQGSVKEATLKAGWAVYDHGQQRIDLRGNVDAEIVKTDKAANQTIIARSERATAMLTGTNSSKPGFSQLELFDNVSLSSTQESGDASNITAGYARYEKESDKFYLRDSVHIVTTQKDDPADIRATEATYWQSGSKVVLSGGVEITQGNNYAKGDSLTALLGFEKRLRSCQINGNGFLKQSAYDRLVQLTAGEMEASFSDDGNLQAAMGKTAVQVDLVPAAQSDYSKVRLTTPKAIHLQFKGAGLLDKMYTEGRTTIQLSVADNQPDSANKQLTADAVSTFFDDSGKNLKKAEAVGNAELFVEPLRAAPQNYKTSIYAPRFDCEFFPTGNNARMCHGGKKTKTVRMPTVNSEGHGEQTIIADELTANFNEGSKDVERLEASGNTKFTESDRSAVAANMSFSQGDRTVRLRGGEPTAWDSSARVKAAEIDWDTAAQRSAFRGGVSTTYYSRHQMNDATPFASSDKPVFVTAESAEFDHQHQVGVYTGNARGWQGNNYVRGDRFTIKQNEGQFLADGNVQSLLYDAKQKRKNGEASVPVYVSAESMSYGRDSRQLSYRSNVDIRQGTDRIITSAADILLDDKNEVTKTIANNGVTITQPGRRAVGDWAQYTAEDEVAVLRGNPAQVEDAENGTSQGAQITVYMRENRVVGESKTSQNTSGRIRSVYKVKNNQ